MRGASLALVLLLSQPASAEDAAQQGSITDGAVRIDWRYAVRGAADEGLGLLELRLADAASGAPLRYGEGRLAAWMQRRRATLAEAETSCPDRVRMLATQGIGRRADIDLNAYRLLTLNTDGTLAVINPFVGLNNAKLESIVELRGDPRAWLQVPERVEAWVVTADPPRLLGIDLHARRIIRAIDLPAFTDAPSLAWDGAAGRLWLALPGREGLGAIDLGRDAQAAGSADSALRVVAASAPLAVWNDTTGGLPGIVSLHADRSVMLRVGEAEPQRWPVPGRPLLLRHSPLARRLVVATDAPGLALIDPEANAPPQAIALGHAVHALALIEDGRRALAVGGGRASLVDLATARVTLTSDTAEGADQLVLTDRFAYAVSAQAGQASLWSLADLRAGRAQPVSVTLGPAHPQTQPRAAATPQAVALPAGNGLLAANPASGMIYQYGEGMMAPIGSYSNYRRAAFGLAVLDLAPREIEPGVYRSPVRHEQGGQHELVVSGVGPRFAACASLRLAMTAAAPAPADNRLRAELIDIVGPTPDRARSVVRVRLRPRSAAVEAAPVAGVSDLVLLVFDRRSGWQQRVRLRETEAGLYEAEVAVPGARQYELLTASQSSNLSFVEGGLGAVRLGASP